MKKIYIVLLTFLLYSMHSFAAENTTGKLYFSVGCFKCPSHSIYVKDGKLLYIKHQTKSPADSTWTTKKVTKNEFEKMIKYLKDKKVMEWKSSYDNRRIEDGISWEIIIKAKYLDIDFKSWGRNAQPKQFNEVREYLLNEFTGGGGY